MSAHTPISPAQPAGSYLSVLAGRWRIIGATFVVALVAAAVVLAATAKTYTAHAQLLVTPISATADEDFVGVPVLRDSMISPTTSVLTVARLVKTPATLAIVQRAYGTGVSAESLAADVTATPLSQTSIVDIAASASSPAAASRLANAFTDATITQRTAVFQRGLRATVARLQRQSDALRGGTVAAQRAALQARLAVLTPLLDRTDPTLQVFNRAVPPASTAAPRPALTLGAAALAGLLLGALLAFLREATDTRVRRIDHVLRELPLDRGRQPIARITHPASRRRFAAAEAVRPFAARLLRSASPTCSIVVISAAEGEGRTSVAIAITRAVGRLRRRVVLAHSDIAHPRVADVFGVNGNGRKRPSPRSKLVRAAAPDEPNVLLALPPRRAAQSNLDLETVTRRRAELHEHADVVVVDAPAAVTDPTAIVMARSADAVVAVARLGWTRKHDLHELSAILSDAGIEPAGVVVLGPSNPLIAGSDHIRGVWSRLRGWTKRLRAWLPDQDEPARDRPPAAATPTTATLNEHLAPSGRSVAAKAVPRPVREPATADAQAPPGS